MKPSNTLRVAIIQSDLFWEDPYKNRAQFESKIAPLHPDIDLIILPEMFTTGFSMSAKKLAETMKGQTVSWMQKIAKEKNCAITGSCIIRESESYYNRLLFVHPTGEIDFYDKRHTFTLARENQVYCSGMEQVIINYKNWNICPLICYDLRFPVWSRNTAPYDVLIYVASWPKPRIDAWDILLQARAIENMSYTIGVNRIGMDANNYRYPGHSSGYDFLGTRLAYLKTQEATIILELKKDIQETHRAKLGFLNDRDHFKFIT